MSTLYDCSRLRHGSKSPLSIGLAMVSVLVCSLFTPNLFGHSAETNAAAVAATNVSAPMPAAPADPNGLTATPASNDRIDLSWLDNSTTESGFKIEVKTGALGTFDEFAIVGANVTSYSSMGLDAGTQYFYRVRAFNADGHSGYSNEASATTLPDPPATPSLLQATAVSNSQINLTWKDNSNNENGFKIERKLSSAVTFTQIATVGPNVTSYLSSGLAVNTEYTFRVRAYNTGGNSAYSTVSATTLPNAPSAPSNLVVMVVSNSRIDLAWQDNANNELGFIVERKALLGAYVVIDTIDANVTTFVSTGLTGGIQYFYRVRAYNTGGNSFYSNEADGTTRPDLPATPNGLSALTVSTDQIDLVWTDNANNEDGFKIDLKIGQSGVYTEIAVLGPNVSEYSSTGLDPGTPYFYRVRAFNVTGHSSFSNEAGATTLPEAPVMPSDLIAAVLSSSQINLTWADNSSDEDGFKIERRLSSAATYTEIATVSANVTSYPNTGLAINTAYTYRVRAYNKGGNSFYSNTVSVTTLPNPPNAPSSLTATPVHRTQIDLSWQDNANNELGFIIERKAGAAGGYVVVDTIDANLTNYASTGLTSSTLYFYRVHAYNIGGNSAFSNEANATTLPETPVAPSNLAAKPGKKRIELEWSDNADNEEGFKIERRLNTAANFTQIATLGANAVAFADTALAVSTTYVYRLRTYNASGHSPYSATVEGTTLPNPPAAPATLAAKVMSSSQIDLTWQDKSTNEGGFKIERKIGNSGTFTQISTVGANVTSFSSLHLAANTKYFYRVRAFNSGGNSAYSNTMEATTLPKAPAAPTNLAAATMSHSRLNLAWQDKSTNEDSFKIERKLGAAGTFAEIAKLPANMTAFADTGLSGSTQYFYRVRASNTGGQSSYSNEANATTNPGPPNAPSGLTATPVNQTRIALVWTDNANNEAGFKIERKISGGVFSQVGTANANATSFADTGLVANTEYFYRVRSYNVTAHSAYTNEANAKTFPVPPAAPAGLTASPIINLQVSLSWQDKSANEDSFRIERKPGAGAFVQIATVPKNAPSYTDGNGLNPVTPYVYRVAAANLGGHSPYSNEAAATTLVAPPLAPGNLSATTAGQTQINIAWQDNANDEDGFKIERKISDGTYTEIASVAANVKNYQDNSLSQDIEYVFRVRAFNAGGHSGYSNEVTAVTLPNPPKAPVNLKATAVSNKRIDLAWADSSRNEAGFRIERKKGAAGTYSQIVSVATNVKTYADTTLLPATQYFYRMRAFNIGGNSGYSLEANATTLPNPPKKPANLTATAVSNKRINLAWADSSANENGFRIERKKGATGTYAQIAQVNANVKSYADSSLLTTTAYTYRVRAFNAGGTSLYSNEATATTLPNPPKAPVQLTATAVSKTRINLAWADSSKDETGFRIERKTGTAGTYAQVGSVGANIKAYADTVLIAGTQYFYRVRAFNIGGNSGYSNEANAKTFPNAPAAPTALAATVAGGDQVTIAWQDNSNDEDGFKVESKLGADGAYTQVATVGPNVTNYESSGLTEGVAYFYRVRAFNIGGNSAYSNEASAIPSSGTNFALNKPVLASSTDSTSSANRGVDGDAITFWRSGFVNSTSAVVTYQVQLNPTLAITIGRVVIKWYQTYFANEYDIQVSNDASNWTTVHTNPAVVTGTQDIAITATPAKYIRLMTKRNNKSNYRISEFEVYGATVAKTAGNATPTASEAIIPESLVLEQNYPNPFNPSTTIAFALPEGMHVSLKVINVTGQEVASLVDGYQDRGIHRVTFNGRRLPSGVYYAVMKAGETTQTKRMVLAK